MGRLFLLISILFILQACGDNQHHDQPQLSGQSPATNASAVATDTAIYVNFDEPIDPSTVDPSSFIVSTQTGTVPGTINTNGTKISFIPSRPLSLQSRYTVTVSPTICSVYGHPVAQSYQWSFTTRDGAWDILPTPPQDSVSETTKAAIDDNGRVLLAWSTVDGTFASFYSDGAWTTPILLGQGGYLNNVVAVNDSFSVFWQSWNGSKIILHCSRYVGGNWQPAEIIASVDATSLFVIPTMFADNTVFLIYWFYGGSDGAHAYALRSINNQGWGQAVGIGDPNPSWYVAGFHRTGKAVLAWSSPGSTTETAYVQNYDVNSGWSEPVTVGEYQYLTAHSATVNSNGQSMVAFSTVSDINVARTTNSGWSQLTSVYQKQQSTLYSPPEIAMDNLGNAMLVMTEGSLDAHSYLAIRYDSNNSWQQPVDISGGRIPDLMIVGRELAVDDAGNYLLLWYGYDALPGGIEHVYSSRYQNGVGWNAPEYLGRQDADAFFSRLSMNKHGEAVGVWLYAFPPGFSDFTLSLTVGIFH